MPPTLESLGIDRLSVDDRITLAQQIWDSIPPGPPFMNAATRIELERRLSDHAADPSDVVSWDAIKAEAEARWRR